MSLVCQSNFRKKNILFFLSDFSGANRLTPEIFLLIIGWKKWYFVTKIVLAYCDKKLVLEIGKNFWNSRLIAEIVQNFWDH